MESHAILIVGVGGLGCELLKCFVSFGFKNIHIIDMDTIELTNLNRQFLFRPSDIGKSKALTAAEYFSTLYQGHTGLSITAHFCRIQEKNSLFYSQFDVVVSGLDSVEGRRWLNAMLHSLLVYDEQDGSLKTDSVIPLIDGGTEGLKGSVRVIIPGITACFECTIGLFPPDTKLQLCTISNRPRKFSHCIEFAAIVLWKESHEETPFDPDSHSHLQWIRGQAEKRALEYGISFDADESSARTVQRILKNIIPAISTTNAFIASVCCNEVVKLSMEWGSTLNNYFLYVGTEGIYSNSFECEKQGGCIVCSSLQVGKKHFLLEEVGPHPE